MEKLKFIKIKKKIQGVFAKKSQILTIRVTVNTTVKLLLFLSSQTKATKTIQ